MPTARVLLVDDEKALLNVLRTILERDGHEVTTCSSGQEALTRYDGQDFDLVITDLKMPGMSGLELLEEIKSREPSALVVVLTAFSTWDNAVTAMRLGAYGYLKKPFDNNEVRALVRRVMERKQVYARLTDAGVDGVFHAGDIIGGHSKITEALEIVRRIAPTDSTVVLSGESGTGKDLFARAIHYGSMRASEPFVAANCGAFTESLLESELFGHTRGSFTGAVHDRKGLFEIAHQGTVFLDEIGEMNAATQVKLLRVLENREVKPVGGTGVIPVDVRIIAATNRDLQALVDQGHFRSDLFYRLDVIRITLPPLRERRSDIPLLAGHFLARYAERLERNVSGFTNEAMDMLVNCDWPGNVRELENTIQRAVALAENRQIGVDDVLLHGATGMSDSTDDAADLPEEGLKLESHLETVERQLIQQALARTEGNLTNAAPLLGLTFRSLRYRVKKLGIDH